MFIFIAAVIFTVLAMAFSLTEASACTGLYIGRKVSADGSTIVGRSEDQGSGAYNKMFKVRDGVTEPGRHYVDSGENQEGFSVPLPETTCKYTYIPDSTDAGDGEYPACSMNEYGLTVVATVTAGASEEYLTLDPYVKPGLREAILAGLLAGQCKTAREAAERLAALIDAYGSEEGNILFFVDPKEAWIFECYGGHNYAGMRMPEDKVAVFGNNFMIETVDTEDRENYIFSPKLFATLDQLGPVKEGGRYHLAKSLSVHPREEYSNMRTWIGHRILAPSTAGKYSDEIFYPLFYTPDKKVSVETAMDIFRDRYEGTEYDMMLPENRGRRPIGVTRTGEVHIVQTFDSLPEDSCHLQWLALGNAEHSVFIPAFGGITETHAAYHVDGSRYSEDSMYSCCKKICAIAETDREYLGQGTKDFWKFQEIQMIDQMQNEVKAVSGAYENGISEGRRYVTKLAEDCAEKQLNNAKSLFDDLFWRMTANADDRVVTTGKGHFAAMVRLSEAEKVYKVKAFRKEGQEFALTKGSKTYLLHIGDKHCTVTDRDEAYEIMLSRKPEEIDKELYLPLDFLKSL